MTALQLLLWISAALLLQVLAASAWALYGLRREAAAARALALTESQPPTGQGTSAWPGWRAFTVAKRVVEDEAQTQCSFHLEPVDGQPLPLFKPGQFLTFKLQVAVPGAPVPRELVRCYSLSDAPAEGHYRVTIKRVPANAPRQLPGLGSTHFHEQVAVGSTVWVKAPAGAFFLDGEQSSPVALVAGGIGITPMMSMLRWALTQQPGRVVHLFYGVRERSEQAFGATLRALAAAHSELKLHLFYSQDEGHCNEAYEHHGRLSAERMLSLLPSGRHAFYICGPGALLSSVVPGLKSLGVQESDIHFEAFGPSSLKAAAPVAALLAPVEVSLRRSGRTLLWDGQDASLLEFAERQGVAMASGCRSGGCGSCETRLLAGRVLYGRQPDFDVQAGHCLPCVGTPAGPLTLDA